MVSYCLGNVFQLILFIVLFLETQVDVCSCVWGWCFLRQTCSTSWTLVPVGKSKLMYCSEAALVGYVHHNAVRQAAATVKITFSNPFCGCVFFLSSFDILSKYLLFFFQTCILLIVHMMVYWPRRAEHLTGWTITVYYKTQNRVFHKSCKLLTLWS